MAVATERGGSITVTRDGTVLDGQQVNGYIHVKADRVVIRNSVIRYGGNYALRVFDGASGTVIEDTKIYCTGPATVGVVFGNYTARDVHLYNCAGGFRYEPAAPATIVDSTWNGKPVKTGADLAAAPATPAESGAGSASDASAMAREAAGIAPEAAAGDDPPEADSPGAGATGVGTAAAVNFPSAATTGVPAGTPLRASGSITVATNGQVISGLDVNGCVIVTADNVVIRKSRIRCGSTYAIRTMPGATNLLVEDVEIDGLGRTSAAVCCDGYTVRRTEIRNVIDGPRLGNNTVVEDSWIHHLIRVGSSHNDALQTTGAVNMVVRRNTLEAYNPAMNDPNNACLMAGSDLAPRVDNLIFENNYCNGGNFSVNISDNTNGRNIRFAGNVFGRNCRYGAVRNYNHPGVTWDRATNVWADTRLAVLG
ncbi:hypothetical protein ACFQUZ_24520 [Plantactinospora sp. GCM10030261]